MTGYKILHEFMDKTFTDPRISKGHLAVYLALFHLWAERDFPQTLSVYSSEVMPKAKISSSNTFHRLVIELNDFGYLRYVNSFYKRKASTYIL